MPYRFPPPTRSGSPHCLNCARKISVEEHRAGNCMCFSCLNLLHLPALGVKDPANADREQVTTDEDDRPDPELQV